MKLYKDYKEEQEQQLQEESDREAMNIDDSVIIIYEHENSFFMKARSIFFMLFLFLFIGIAVFFLAEYICGLPN